MKRLLRIFLLTLALAGLACGPVLADEIVALKAGYLMLSPEGQFAVDGNALAGTRVDLDKDLGFDDSENYFVEGALNLGPFRLAVSYLPLEFSGAGTLNQTIDFNGTTFDVGVATTSEVKIDIVDAGVTWHVINLDDLPARIQLGPELAVKLVDADLTMTGESGGLSVTETENVQVPIPTIGARARIGFADYLGLVGRIGYMEFQDNSFLDAEAQIEFSPIPLVGIFGGYRYFDLQVDDSGVFVDAQFAGPFAGAFVRF
jgi:hypothetical protein